MNVPITRTATASTQVNFRVLYKAGTRVPTHAHAHAHTPTRPVKVAPPSLRKRAASGSSLLRYLFPHTRQRARTHLSKLRHDTLPALRHRAQSRIYRYLVHRRKRAVGSSIISLLRKRGRSLLSGVSVEDGGAKARRSKMTLPGTSRSSDSYDSGDRDVGGLQPEGREPGSRRRKFAGYLKAANELRQSYQQSYVSGWGSRDVNVEEANETPGAFSDAAVIRAGDEEMVLFPSYARKHIKSKVLSPTSRVERS